MFFVCVQLTLDPKPNCFLCRIGEEREADQKRRRQPVQKATTISESQHTRGLVCFADFDKIFAGMFQAQARQLG